MASVKRFESIESVVGSLCRSFSVHFEHPGHDQISVRFGQGLTANIIDGGLQSRSSRKSRQ